MHNKVFNFTDLKVWKLGHSLVLDLYLVTKSFPKDELFGLISQIRRAAVSVTSNIAEGFCRPTAKDKARFYVIALGSVTELQNQLLISRDLSYLQDEMYLKIAGHLIEMNKMLHALIKTASSAI